jgi:hypothetical protein
MHRDLSARDLLALIVPAGLLLIAGFWLALLRGKMSRAPSSVNR